VPLFFSPRFGPDGLDCPRGLSGAGKSDFALRLGARPRKIQIQPPGPSDQLRTAAVCNPRKTACAAADARRTPRRRAVRACPKDLSAREISSALQENGGRCRASNFRNARTWPGRHFFILQKISAARRRELADPNEKIVALFFPAAMRRPCDAARSALFSSSSSFSGSAEDSQLPNHRTTSRDSRARRRHQPGWCATVELRGPRKVRESRPSVPRCISADGTFGCRGCSSLSIRPTDAISAERVKWRALTVVGREKRNEAPLYRFHTRHSLPAVRWLGGGWCSPRPAGSPRTYSMNSPTMSAIS